MLGMGKRQVVQAFTGIEMLPRLHAESISSSNGGPITIHINTAKNTINVSDAEGRAREGKVNENRFI
jgi:hypothetical protein